MTNTMEIERDGPKEEGLSQGRLAGVKPVSVWATRIEVGISATLS